VADELFEERRRALEEAFFRKHNREVLDRLKAEAKRLSAKQGIAEATGIGDDALLTRLADLGFDASSLLAFALVPAVEVAWADGIIDEAERTHILARLTPEPFASSSPTYEMIASWLSRRPPAELFDAWVAYTRALCAGLAPADRQWLAAGIVRRSEEVAKASGGLFGVALRKSSAEADVLRKIEAAFAG
jgi:hypothetical protein